eukprot:5220890-Alexandrium_andersonii.AAC.1
MCIRDRLEFGRIFGLRPTIHLNSVSHQPHADHKFDERQPRRRNPTYTICNLSKTLQPQASLHCMSPKVQSAIRPRP